MSKKKGYFILEQEDCEKYLSITEYTMGASEKDTCQ